MTDLLARYSRFTLLTDNQEILMTPQDPQLTRWGKIRYGLAAILLGLPLPIVIIAFLWGGCTSR